MQGRLVTALTMICLTLFSTAKSQWSSQYAGLPAGLDTKQLYLAPVDANICWAAPVVISNSQASYIRTTNAGVTWTASAVPGAFGIPASSLTVVDAQTAWIVFAEGSAASGVYRTTNGGVGWTKQTTAFPSGSSPRFIKFFDAANGVAVGNPNGGYWEIYTTLDGGNNWVRVASDSIPLPLSGEAAYVGGVPCSYGDRWFWFPTNSQSVYRTTNRGRSWAVSRNVYPGAFGMGVAFRDSLNGMLSGDGTPVGFRRSTDSGVTWAQVSAPSGVTASFITAVPGARGSYVASSFDLFGWSPGSAYTRDDGASWTTIDNRNHGRSAFLSPAIGWSGGGNDSLHRWTGTALPVLENHGSAPLEFVLVQNYPNPFNPATRIQYSVRGSGFVSLKVYDVLGREVRTLVNENLQAGSYAMTFDATGLASGIYFYRLQAGEFVDTKRLVLLK
jgi:photosystem II stability/assembly factor-like uncharacterized protein